MSESKTPWTPGPWDVSGLIVYDTCLDAVASVNDAADARLIAAAPEMASIIQRFIALPSGAWHPERHAAEEAELMQDARALLAKIGGQS